jgi:hypothetical protein
MGGILDERNDVGDSKVGLLVTSLAVARQVRYKRGAILLTTRGFLAGE